MSAPFRSKRFAPTRGDDVPWVMVGKGDWAYVMGYWWHVVAIYAPANDQIKVKLERPGLKADVHVLGVQRWRKA